MVVPRILASGFRLGLAPLYDRHSLGFMPQATVVYDSASIPILFIF